MRRREAEGRYTLQGGECVYGGWGVLAGVGGGAGGRGRRTEKANSKVSVDGVGKARGQRDRV